MQTLSFIFVVCILTFTILKDAYLQPVIAESIIILKFVVQIYFYNFFENSKNYKVEKHKYMFYLDNLNYKNSVSEQLKGYFFSCIADKEELSEEESIIFLNSLDLENLKKDNAINVANYIYKILYNSNLFLN